MPRRRPPAKRVKRPRVPLPRQTGGAHPDRTKRPARKAKHKPRYDEE
jgi:hypothetical protein